MRDILSSPQKAKRRTFPAAPYTCTKKLPAAYNRGELHLSELLLNGSTNGANAVAGAALDASFSVDLVLAVALSDSGNGALISTSAAGDTSISNNVSHGITSKIILMRYG